MKASLFLFLHTALFLCLLIPASAQNLSDFGQLESEQQKESPYRVTGTVSGPTGPAENVTVHIEVRDTRARRPFLFMESKTDTQGYFEFSLDQVRAPEIALEFYTTSYRYQMASYIERVMLNQLPLNVDLTVSPGIVASGIVTDENGEPLEDVEVSGTNLLPQVSDENGKFEIFGLSTDYHQLTFYKEGYSKEFHTINQEDPGRVDGVEVMLTAAGEFSGTITTWNGEPVVGAQIIYQAPERYLKGSTNENGAFQFRGVPEGHEDVQIMISTLQAPPLIHHLTDEEMTSGTADISLKPSTFLYGKVELQNGTAAANATLTVRSLSDDLEKQFTLQARASSDGTFRVGPFNLGQPISIAVEPPSLQRMFAMSDIDFFAEPDQVAHRGFIEFWPQGFSSEFDVLSYGDGELRMVRRDDGEGGFGGEVIYTGAFVEERNTIEGKLVVESLELNGTFVLRSQYGDPKTLSGMWTLNEQYTNPEKCFSPLAKDTVMPMLPSDKVVSLTLNEGLTLTGRVDDPDGIYFDGKVIMYDWKADPGFYREADIKSDGSFSFECVPFDPIKLVAQTGDSTEVTDPIVARGGNSGVVIQTDPDAKAPMMILTD